MIETDFFNMIYNQGVAIAMLVYFVVRFEKILKDNTASLNLLSQAVSNCPKNKKV